MSRIGGELNAQNNNDDNNNESTPQSLFSDVDDDNNSTDEVGLRRNVSTLLLKQSSIKNRCIELSNEANTIYRSAKKPPSSTPFSTPLKNRHQHHDAQHYSRQLIANERTISGLQVSVILFCDMSIFGLPTK